MTDEILSMLKHYPYKTMIKSLLARNKYAVMTDGRSAIVAWGPTLIAGGECSEAFFGKLTAALENSKTERYLNLPDGEWMERIACAYPGRYDEKRGNVYAAGEGVNADVKGCDCVLPVTAALIESGLVNIGVLTQELYSYLSPEDFYKTGYGLALVKDNAIRGYCLSEYSVDGEFGVNIWVDEKYRRQGYARAMTERILAHAKKERRRAYWACFADNIPSNNLARSCGFTLDASRQYWLWRKQ